MSFNNQNKNQVIDRFFALSPKSYSKNVKKSSFQYNFLHLLIMLYDFRLIADLLSHIVLIPKNQPVKFTIDCC